MEARVTPGASEGMKKDEELARLCLRSVLGLPCSGLQTTSRATRPAVPKLPTMSSRHPKTDDFSLPLQVQRSWGRTLVGLAWVLLYTNGGTAPRTAVQSYPGNTAVPDGATSHVVGEPARYT